MNPFKKLAGQTAIYGIPTILGRMLNYLLVPLYTYIFSTSEYGVVTEMYAYSSVFLVILTYGMETALFRFSQMEENKDKVYSTALISIIISSAIFILISCFFATPISNGIHYPNNREYIIWFALILGTDALCNIVFARLREQDQAKKFAVIKSINISINILLNVFFIVICRRAYLNTDSSFHTIAQTIYNPAVGVGYIFLSNLVASVITVVLLLPEYLKIRFAFDSVLWKKMMFYALPLMLAGLGGIINETMDRILLKYLLPDKSTAMAQLGIYGACYKVAILMTIFIQTFRFAAEPFFFSHSKEKNAQQTYADVMKYFVIACSFIFLATMMYIDFIQYFVGEDFRTGLKVVPILLLANLCLGIFFNLSIWYKLTGDTRYGAYLSAFGAAITLLFNFWLIPTMGYMASAWTTLICYFSMMVASYFIGQKNYPINYDLKRILGYLGLSLILFFISISLSFNTVPVKLGVNTFLLLIFVVTIYFFEKPRMQNADQNN